MNKFKNTSGYKINTKSQAIFPLRVQSISKEKVDQQIVIEVMDS